MGPMRKASNVTATRRRTALNLRINSLQRFLSRSDPLAAPFLAGTIVRSCPDMLPAPRVRLPPPTGLTLRETDPNWHVARWLRLGRLHRGRTPDLPPWYSSQ